ncbi:ATP-binding protein [bacterium]|nr:MAG: ATP-binding protein [bacterium]
MQEIFPVRSKMNLQDLRNLIKTGESSFLEFKRTIPSPEKIAREMCAFANSNGGILIIGIDDDGSLVGVESYYEQHFLLTEATNYLLKPAIEPEIEIIPFKNKEIVLVKIKEAEDKPVFVDLGDEWAGFVRVNDKSIKASKEMLQVLKNRTSEEGVTFEFGPNEQKLFRFLNQYERITVNEFSNLVNISYRRASRILVNLVSAGVLNLFTHEKAEFFTLARPV